MCAVVLWRDVVGMVKLRDIEHAVEFSDGTSSCALPRSLSLPRKTPDLQIGRFGTRLRWFSWNFSEAVPAKIESWKVPRRAW